MTEGKQTKLEMDGKRNAQSDEESGSRVIPEIVVGTQEGGRQNSQTGGDANGSTTRLNWAPFSEGIKSESRPFNGCRGKGVAVDESDTKPLEQILPPPVVNLDNDRKEQ